MLIADSGSTKTDYRYVDTVGNIQQLQSPGLNPIFHSSESISKILEDILVELAQKPVDIVYFYGAGCSSEERVKIVERAFKSSFPLAKIKVEHDLLGAARATCGHNEGMVGILGTGSNSCIFDGEKILSEYPSSGYILGDEGGGVYMGKLLIKHYLEGKLPAELKSSFEQRYQLTRDDIIHKIYKEGIGSSFLASFSKFIFHHREHPFILQIIQKNFQDYMQVQLKSFEKHSLNTLSLVGSVAFYYQEYISSQFAKEGIRIGRVLEKPIAGLTLYHLNMD